MLDVDNYLPIKDLDLLTEPNHWMLLYDKEEYGNLVKYRYLEIGLKKGENSIYVSHDEPTIVEDEMRSNGIDVDYFKKKNLLHILKIESNLEKDEDFESRFNEYIEMIRTNFNRPLRIIGRLISDVSTGKEIHEELMMEKLFHSNFDKFQTSLLCTYNVNGIEKSKRSAWLAQLLNNHHYLIYASEPETSVSFDPSLLKSLV